MDAEVHKNTLFKLVEKENADGANYDDLSFTLATCIIDFLNIKKRSKCEQMT